MIVQVFPFEIDDSYISMRYASNLAARHGLMFNPGGARIEGYTNLLLVFIEAGLMRVGVWDLQPVKLLLTGFGLVTLFIIAWYGQQRFESQTDDRVFRWIPAVAALLLATSSPYVLWTVGGLETILFACLVCMGAVANSLFLSGRLHGPKVLLVDLIFLMATLTRTEGLLFWGVSVGYTLVLGLFYRERVTWARVWGILGGLFCLGVYALWKLSYFGQLLPATYLAKEQPIYFRTFLAGGARLLDFLSINGNFFIALFLMVGLGLLVARRRTPVNPPVWYLTILSGVYLAYVLSRGFQIAMDDAYRFYVPLLPLASLLFLETVDGLQAEVERSQPTWLVGILIALAFLLPMRFIDLRHAWEIDLNWGALPYRVAARDVANGLQQGHIALGRWLRDHAPADATMVLFDAGAIPYFSGLRTIDTWSLTDPTLLTLNRSFASAASDEEREHIRSDMVAYVLSQQPEYIVQDGLSLLDDPAVRARYCRIDQTWVYLDWYLSGPHQTRRYVLEPWQRCDVR
jgi:hypothetical protein